MIANALIDTPGFDIVWLLQGFSVTHSLSACFLLLLDYQRLPRLKHRHTRQNPRAKLLAKFDLDRNFSLTIINRRHKSTKHAVRPEHSQFPPKKRSLIIGGKVKRS